MKLTKEMVGKRFLMNDDYYDTSKYYEVKLLEITEDEAQVKLEYAGGTIRWENNNDKRLIKELKEK